MNRLDVGGRALTKFLGTLLAETGAETGNSFDTPEGREILTDYKEKQCYVALDFDAEMRAASVDIDQERFCRGYRLPDGSVIRPGTERFRCPEALFQPSFLGMESAGIHDATWYAITKSDEDIRADLCSNIVLCGGATMFPGMEERIARELRVRMRHDVTVVAPPRRMFSAWIGGSILASSSDFGDLWVTKEEFHEFGPQIIHRRCL